jgi:hypothetical protein
VVHVLSVLLERVDDLLAGDDPRERYLGMRGLGALAVCDPGGFF